ncbi:hypothetical protein MP638_004679 [Amoeboaphelidium occidentale]|nr:hypothetical protein MP638_004679 [Amoeboaphelidium occidentale]
MNSSGTSLAILYKYLCGSETLIVRSDNAPLVSKPKITYQGSQSNIKKFARVPKYKINNDISEFDKERVKSKRYMPVIKAIANQEASSWANFGPGTGIFLLTHAKRQRINE